MRLDLSAQTLFIIPKFFLNPRAVVLSRPPALDYRLWRHIGQVTFSPSTTARSAHSNRNIVAIRLNSVFTFG